MRSICIAGMGPTKNFVKQQDTDVEIWGFNISHIFLPRWDRWFQLHPRNWREQAEPTGEPGDEKWGLNEKREANCFGRTKEHVEFLRACDVPVYMRRRFHDIPTSQPYPLWEVVGALGRPYFRGTASYMIALALYEHVDRIVIAGIDLAEDQHQYCFEHGSVGYWLGRAEQRGVELVMPPGDVTLTGPLYGRMEETLDDRTF